jgi:hypothetical protein
MLAEEHAVADHRHACNLDARELGPEPRVFERGIRERVVEVEPEAAREQGQHGVEHCPAREAAACHPGPVDEDEVRRLGLELGEDDRGQVVRVDASPRNLLPHERRVVDGGNLVQPELGDERARLGAEVGVLLDETTAGRREPGAFSAM